MTLFEAKHDRLGNMRRLDSTTLCEPLQAQLNTTRLVHIQQSDRGATDRRLADDHSAGAMKVFQPNIGARVEYVNLLATLLVNARQIRSFEGVAAVAGIRKSGWIVVCYIDMLPGQNMLDVEAYEGRRCLRHVTVLASIAGTSPHKVPRCGVHSIGRWWRGTGGPSTE